MPRFLQNLGIEFDALQLGTFSGFNLSTYSQTQAGRLDYINGSLGKTIMRLGDHYDFLVGCTHIPGPPVWPGGAAR
jgi:hypothetical protein